MEVYKYTQHVFGTKSSPTCAIYALHQVAKDNAVNDESLVKKVQWNFSQNTARSDLKVRNTLSKGGFKLMKWITSDEEVKSQIPETDRSTKVVKTLEIEPQSSSIRGLNWIVNTDSLIVCRGTEHEVPAKNNSENCSILCLISVRPTWDMFTLHDKNAVLTLKHLGSNVTSMGQRVVSRTLKTVQWLVLWVERNKNDVNKPTLFWKRMHKPETSHLYRCIRGSNLDYGISARWGNAKTDISNREMSCGTHQTHDDTEVRTSSRVRLRKHIRNEHDVKIDKIFHWSDSSTVLQWLQAAHKKQQCVRCEQSSGKTGKLIRMAKRAAWLQAEEEKWPKPWCQVNEVEAEQATSTIATENKLEQLFDWRRYSTFNRIRNFFAYCMRFKTKQRGTLKADKIHQAEQILFRFVQNESFPNASKSIANSKEISKTLKIAKLSPFIEEDGIIRVKGRLRHSNLAYNAKHPILLTAKHPVVQLLLEKEHRDNLHEGTEYVRNMLQQ